MREGTGWEIHRRDAETQRIRERSEPGAGIVDGTEEGGGKDITIIVFLGW